MTRVGDNRGFTLIEMIIFIIIGGIFLPVSMIAFTAAMKSAANPEQYVKGRFIAEAKMEDITSRAFENLPSENPNYRAVRGDVTNPSIGGGAYRFGSSAFDGYQWKWLICDTASNEINLACSAPHTTTVPGYKRIEVIVLMPDNTTYGVYTLVTKRPKS